jgi:hypothetical protein
VERVPVLRLRVLRRLVVPLPLPPDVLATVVQTAIMLCVENVERWVAEEEQEKYERVLMKSNMERYGPAMDGLAPPETAMEDL